MAITVMDSLARTVQKYPTKAALRFKSNGVWKSLSWQDYEQTVHLLARGLCALGLPERSAVGILSYNNKEWVLADVAAIFAGAVPAGIYPTSSPEQCAYILEHCKASCAIVEDAKQLAKILSIRSQLPDLKFIVLMKGKSREANVYSWDEVLGKAEDFSNAELDLRIQKQSPKDLATFVYTSGTTANPKAVMLSHDNLTWMSQTCVQYDLKLTQKDSLLSYLPLSHIAEQMTTIHGPMYIGACISFAESMDTVANDLREERPTIFLGVPRVWEKIHSKMVKKEGQASGAKKWIAQWAKGIGRRCTQSMGHQNSLSYTIANKLVFSKVRKALGLDRCRLAVSAAAPIAHDTLEYFMSMGIPICEIYGMSECTGPATVTTMQNFKFAKAGFCIKGGELRIADDGEILVRGRHIFMGYLNDAKATQEAIDSDGWLHSGDIGEIDADGFLSVTGRKKNLIITAGGENIAPEMLEDKLKTIPEIEQAVVIGDRKKFLTALITIKPESLEEAKKKIGTNAATNSSDMLASEEFHQYLQKQINSINSTVARMQTIKDFRILPASFSEESGELTPTMKVKRGVVMQKFSNKIDEMYS